MSGVGSIGHPIGGSGEEGGGASPAEGQPAFKVFIAQHDGAASGDRAAGSAAEGRDGASGRGGAGSGFGGRSIQSSVRGAASRPTVRVPAMSGLSVCALASSFSQASSWLSTGSGCGAAVLLRLALASMSAAATCLQL